jgi:hypothetical protein
MGGHTCVTTVDVDVVEPANSSTELRRRNLRHEHRTDSEDDAGGYAANYTPDEKHFHVLRGSLEDGTYESACVC